MGEHDHDREEAIEADEMDDSGNSTAAASRPAPKKKTEAKPQAMIIYFVDFAMEGIAKLDYKFEVNGKTISGSTDAEGKAETLKDYRYGSVVDVKVLKAHTQDYVSIGEITSVLSETVYNIMSPKIKLEIETEPHKG